MDLNHHTGEAIRGWAHVVQSIQTILATRLETRVFRREFGADVPALVDEPMNDASVMAHYVAVAEALERWEPRFELTDIEVAAIAPGVIAIALTGNYRPNAHKGDLTIIADETRIIRLQRDREDNWSLAA